MNSLNSILLEGNLVRDPETGETAKGTKFCRFSIASNRFYKQEGSRVDEVSYFDVEVWSKLAENCYANLEKGRGVRVVGRLKQDRWQDEEGKGRTKVKIVGEHVEFKPQFKKNEEEPAESAVEEDKEPVF
ncbi:MAG: single-stranded DNA-binding protein [Spirochaetales bacterium]|nr:single-stranded DNA-binding protein [Spirochaetales bacterium]